jgi:hypothetical protein
MINKKDINVTSDLSEATTEIEKFAKNVFDKLIEENVYPIPYYYSIYFFNMLEDESIEFKKSVMELIELEGQNEFEEDLKFEQKLKKSFKYSKELIQHSAYVYKLSNALKEKNNIFLKEVDNVSTPQVFKNILNTSKKNISEVRELLRSTCDEQGIKLFSHESGGRGKIKKMMQKFPKKIVIGNTKFLAGLDLNPVEFSALFIHKVQFDHPKQPLIQAQRKRFQNDFEQHSTPRAIARLEQDIFQIF